MRHSWQSNQDYCIRRPTIIVQYRILLQGMTGYVCHIYQINRHWQWKVRESVLQWSFETERCELTTKERKGNVQDKECSLLGVSTNTVHLLQWFLTVVNLFQYSWFWFFCNAFFCQHHHHKIRPMLSEDESHRRRNITIDWLFPWSELIWHNK